MNFSRPNRLINNTSLQVDCLKLKPILTIWVELVELLTINLRYEHNQKEKKRRLRVKHGLKVPAPSPDV